ncbi:MAG: protein kinase [Caldimonas sp.]
MTAGVEEIKRLSALLDEALDLKEADRPAWLAALQGDAARLAPRLRSLLEWQTSNPTDPMLERPPLFDVAAGDADAEPEFTAGERVGPYRLLREIGRGGMGEVWLAERADGQLKRSVALKLPVLGARRRILVQRFARERDIVGALVHPHIARLYDAGLADDGQPYLALEYVEGLAITDYCDERRLDARARVALLRQVMEAVQYAHANLVVHRDLKPSNVLVTAQGQAMLLDFGIAKLLQEERGEARETELTQLGGRALTLQYAAPEQFSGAPVSIATDVWALGVLLYELLVGQRRFDQPTRRAQEQAVLAGEPVRPGQHRAGAIAALSRSAAADLDTVVLKALKKAPAERYATVDAMAEDLARWLDGRPVRAQRASAWYRLRKAIARNRIASAATLAVAMALLIGAGVAAWQARLARQSASLASQESARAQRERNAATAVRDFLIGVFRASDPDAATYAAQQTRSVRDVLSDGIARLRGSMEDQPESKSALYEALTGILINLTETDRALELAREHVAFAERTLGAGHERVAVALTGEAEVQVVLGEQDTARRLMERAEALLAARGDHGSAVWARLAILKAQLYGPAEAEVRAFLADARRGVELLAAHGAAPAERVTALIGIASRYADLGDGPRAIEEFDAAASLAHDFEGAALLRARGLAARASAQVTLGRIAAAIDSQRAALRAAQELPVDHPEVGREMLLLGVLLHAYLDRGEGRGRLADGLERSSRALPAGSPSLNNARMMAFNAMRLDGDHQAAAALVPLLAAAVDDVALQVTQRQQIGLSLARHHAAAGEAGKAAGMLDRIVPLLGALPAVMTPPVLLAQAQVALARGEPARAAALVEHVTRIEAAQGHGVARAGVIGEVAWREVRRERLLVESLVAERSQRPARAVEAAREALALSLESPQVAYASNDLAEARLRLGTALLAGGELAQARQPLAQAERFYALNHAPASPLLRDARAALARVDAGSTRAVRALLNASGAR